MSRGDELAHSFREAYLPVLAFIESADNRTWSTYIPAEEGTVAAVMNHVAQSMRYSGSVLKAFRLGNPPVQLSQEMIDSFNQAEKAEAGEPAMSAVLEAVRTGVDRIAASLGATPDKEFASETRIQVGDHIAETLEQWTVEITIPHGLGHLETCRSALS
jgi:Mycothiol maleylpyruvate isomerase N-terminal domain